MPDVILSKRRYAAYLLPLYVQDSTFIDFVNDELDPSGQLGSIIPEFVQTTPALGQTATVSTANTAAITQTLGPMGQTASASEAAMLTSSQALAALQQAATGTVV